ncbi:hypothetical protein [Thiolapillus sp.]|uniref:hypothetical protein n=1 Tax=Thiolapillus sp. TaxID=2017437 RepID=UPI003AF83EFC
MSDVFLSGISGLSFDSTLLSSVLFFCQVLLLFLFYLFSACCPILLTFFPENSSIFFLKREALFFFCMALVWQLGEVSWLVVCAACCHMVLVFAVMHLYNIFDFLLLLSIPFCVLFFFNLVLINQGNGPQY